MWIKNATIFGINPKFKFAPDNFALTSFAPVSEFALMSSGWSPVRGDELCVKLGLHSLLNFTIEKKVIPASAVKTRLAAKRAEIEQAQGFAPGKKATKELKERVIDEMLPTAFAARTTIQVWIDQVNHRLIVDSTSGAVVDMIQIALIKAFGDIGLQDIYWPGADVLTDWLDIEAPHNFTTDDEVTLQWPGERGKTAKFAKANLGDTDIGEGIRLGAQVSALAMTFDRRLSFVITDNVQLRRIRPLDVITSAEREGDVDAFENDFFLMTAEISALINALVELA